MFLDDALVVVGVFLLGATAGACLKYARYRGLVALCNQLLAETSSLHPDEGMLMKGHFGCSPVEEATTSYVARVELPVSVRAEFSKHETADFQLQPGRPEH
jgi:hypothetical protein